MKQRNNRPGVELRFRLITRRHRLAKCDLMLSVERVRCLGYWAKSCRGTRSTNGIMFSAEHASRPSSRFLQFISSFSIFCLVRLPPQHLPPPSRAPCTPGARACPYLLRFGPWLHARAASSVPYSLPLSDARGVQQALHAFQPPFHAPPQIRPKNQVFAIARRRAASQKKSVAALPGKNPVA